MMVVVAGLTTLTKLAQAIDNHFAYPKAGANLGGGSHAPSAQSVTQTHALVLQNYTTPTTYGYPLYIQAWVDLYNQILSACQAAVAAGTATALQTAIAQLPAPIADDGTWFPPVVVLP